MLLAIVMTLLATALIFGLGLKSALIANAESKSKQFKDDILRKTAENKSKARESGGNKANPEAMEMAAGGTKN
jgi:hypothetical protein